MVCVLSNVLYIKYSHKNIELIQRIHECFEKNKNIRNEKHYMTYIDYYNKFEYFKMFRVSFSMHHYFKYKNNSNSFRKGFKDLPYLT